MHEVCPRLDERGSEVSQSLVDAHVVVGQLLRLVQQRLAEVLDRNAGSGQCSGQLHDARRRPAQVDGGRTRVVQQLLGGGQI